MNSTTLFIYLTLCGFVAMLGSERKTGYWGALLISLIIGPLFGLIVILMFKKKNSYEIENLISIAKEFDESIHEEFEQLNNFRNEKIINKTEYSLALENLNSKIDKTFHDKFGVNFNEKEKSLINKFVNYGFHNNEKIIFNISRRVIRRVDSYKWQKIIDNNKQKDWIIIKGS